MGLKKATVKLGADIGEFTSKMRKASSSFKKMGKNIQKAGKTMSMSLTAPLTAALALAQSCGGMISNSATTGTLPGPESNESRPTELLISTPANWHQAPTTNQRCWATTPMTSA